MIRNRAVRDGWPTMFIPTAAFGCVLLFSGALFAAEPQVSIRISPNKVAAGEPFSITVSATTAEDLPAGGLWWYLASYPGKSPFPQNRYPAPDSVKGKGTVKHTWENLIIDWPGIYIFKANARDVKGKQALNAASAELAVAESDASDTGAKKRIVITSTTGGQSSGGQQAVERKPLTTSDQKKISENEYAASNAPPDKRVAGPNGVTGSIRRDPSDLKIFQNPATGKDKLMVPGFRTDLTPGAPTLPSATLQLEVPEGKSYKSVTYKSNWVDVPVSVNLAPGPLPRPTGSGDMPYQNFKHRLSDTQLAARFKSDEFFPRDPVRFVHVGVLDGKQVVTVKVAPVQYNPVTGKMRFHHSIDYEVKYE